MPAIARHWPDLRWALIIFAVALLLRVAFAVWIRPDPEIPTNDAYHYNYSARALADGRGYIFVGRGEAPTAHYPPGYAGLLAAVYLLPGPDVIAGRMLNVAAGAATCVVVFAIGRLMWNRMVGVSAGLILAFFPSPIFQSTILMTEVVWAATLSGIVLFFVWQTFARGRASVQTALLLGVLLGMATLVRGEGALLPVVFGLAWFFSTRSRRRAIAYTAAAFLGLAVVLSGWTVRNIIQLGAPVPISTGSASTFAQGHWEGADGWPSFERAKAVQARYRELPYPERDVKWSRRAVKDGLVYMLTHPVHELSLVPRRLYYLYYNDRSPIDFITNQPIFGKGQELPIGQRAFDRLRAVSDAYYFAAIGWAVIGAVLWWRQRPELAFVLLGMVVYISLIFGVLFVGEPRYHASLIPVLSLLAAPAALVVVGKAPAPAPAPGPSEAAQ